MQNIRAMHDIELFTTWVGFSIICAYPAEDVRKSISWSEVLVMSFFHQLEQRPLKSPVTMKHIGNSSFILLRSKSKFTQKLSNSSWLYLGNGKYRLKNTFHL